jgi:glycosyltransferase involved in cell wall biosynthesis
METNEIQLSILIPSVPSRFVSLEKLFAKLLKFAENRSVEVLSIIDNKIKSIGEKRDALVQNSKGKYFMFIDDDDDAENLSDVYEATFLDVDVITFKSECQNIDGSKFIVTHNIGNPIEHNTDELGNYLDCKRPPWHCCAWNRRFSYYRFPSVSYGEDWGWIKQFLDLLQTEHYIDKIIYYYNYNPKITEASTGSNSEWINPNHNQ